MFVLVVNWWDERNFYKEIIFGGEDVGLKMVLSFDDELFMM